MRLSLLQSLFALIAALCPLAITFGQSAKEPAPTEAPPTILFVCEHGAAKSVIAAAYFDKLAKERGLNYRAVFRGANPDPTLAASAVKGLNEDGIDTRGWKPELVTKKDLDAASAVVTLGCALPGKEAVASKVVEWNDTPPVGQNYQAARDYLVKQVQSLIDELPVARVSAVQTKLDFNQDKPGSPPSNFTTALTGKGKPGVWVVLKDDTAPSKGNVLAQTDADRTGYRFPVCVYDGLTVKDADISVKLKAISGKGDQGGGLLWRYQDKDNYYIVRANALEDNVVLYKVQHGQREDLPLKGEGKTYGKKVKVPPLQWNTLRVIVAGKLFTVYFNGAKLYEVEDTTFTEAGKVGLWTKADSVIHFDDLEVKTK